MQSRTLRLSAALKRRAARRDNDARADSASIDEILRESREKRRLARGADAAHSERQWLDEWGGRQDNARNVCRNLVVEDVCDASEGHAS